jgi:threonine dehydratase
MRSIELADVREARKPIPKTIVRTPLFRLELGPDYPDIRLKLENLQPINAYSLLSDLKMERPLGLLLHHNRAGGDSFSVNHIVDAEANQIAAA